MDQPEEKYKIVAVASSRHPRVLSINPPETMAKWRLRHQVFWDQRADPNDAIKEDLETALIVYNQILGSSLSIDPDLLLVTTLLKVQASYRKIEEVTWGDDRGNAMIVRGLAARLQIVNAMTKEVVRDVPIDIFNSQHSE